MQESRLSATNRANDGRNASSVYLYVEIFENCWLSPVPAEALAIQCDVFFSIFRRELRFDDVEGYFFVLESRSVLYSRFLTTVFPLWAIVTELLDSTEDA